MLDLVAPRAVVQTANAAEILATARALVPDLARRAAATEANRSLLAETIADFHRLGLFRMLQPRAFGGKEIDPKTYFDVLITIAEGCASSAWVLGILSVHAWQLAHFPLLAQQEVWGDDPQALASSSYQPSGKVTRVPGGFRLSGRWQFSSGCDHAQWVILGAIVPEDTGPDIPRNAVPNIGSFLLPRADYQIDDTWFTAGLCGTGSKDIVVEHAFVPAHRHVSFLQHYRFETEGLARYDNPTYRFPFGQVFQHTITMPALGIARAALEQYRLRVLGYPRGGFLTHPSEDPMVLQRLAQAQADLNAAHGLLHRNMDLLAEIAAHGTDYPIALRTRLRFESIYIMNMAVRVVEALYAASGGHAIFKENPIQRQFRDIEAIRVHGVNVPDRAAVGHGHVMLGANPLLAGIFL